MLAHIQEVMEDADMYSWKCVRSYHMAYWLHQIEQGRAEEAKKIKLSRALV